MVWKALKRALTHPMVNVGVSAVVLYILITHIQWVEIWAELKVLPWTIFVMAASLSMLLIVPHAFRWCLITRGIGKSLAFPKAIELLFLGYLFNQVLPTSFGGDVIRAGCLKSNGYRLRHAVSSVLIDRAMALLALSVLFISFYPRFWGTLPQMPFMGVFILLAAVLCGAFVFLAWHPLWLRLISRLPVLRKFVPLLADFCSVCQKKTSFMLVIGLSLFIQLMIGVVFYILAHGLGIGLSLLTCISFFPLINLATLIPVSFAGWGVREGVVVYMLHFFNVPADQAFSLSVLYGAAFTLTGVPGLWFWFKGAHRASQQTMVSAVEG